jgi:oxalate decarboxylase/phosphoglucose isomerase-like protein (cupin superfamily)
MKVSMRFHSQTKRHEVSIQLEGTGEVLLQKEWDERSFTVCRGERSDQSDMKGRWPESGSETLI